MHIIHAESVNGFSPCDAQVDAILSVVNQIVCSDKLSAKEKCATIEKLLPAKAEDDLPVAVSAAQLARHVAWTVWQKTNGICTYCGERLNPFDRGAPNGFHIDHSVARANGGTDDIGNLVPSCMACNCSKRALTPDVWRSSCGR